MRAAFAVGVLVVVILLLSTLNVRTGSLAGLPPLARTAVAGIVGILAAAVTVSIGIDVIPDDAEGSMFDLAAIMLAGLCAIVLVLRRLR